MNGVLTRFAYLKTATLGELHFGNFSSFATLELPWRRDKDGPGGEPLVSCVPDGLYTLRAHQSQRHGPCFALVNESLGVYYQPGDIPKGQQYGRSAVLIHVANSTHEIQGCIAIGMHHANDALMVVNSKAAMNALRDMLGSSSTHSLTIRPHEGTRENAA